jgi:hypothetical protein
MFELRSAAPRQSVAWRSRPCGGGARRAMRSGTEEPYRSFGDQKSLPGVRPIGREVRWALPLDRQPEPVRADILSHDSKAVPELVMRRYARAPTIRTSSSVVDDRDEPLAKGAAATAPLTDASTLRIPGATEVARHEEPGATLSARDRPVYRYRLLLAFMGVSRRAGPRELRTCSGDRPARAGCSGGPVDGTQKAPPPNQPSEHRARAAAARLVGQVAVVSALVRPRERRPPRRVAFSRLPVGQEAHGCAAFSRSLGLAIGRA